MSEIDKYVILYKTSHMNAFAPSLQRINDIPELYRESVAGCITKIVEKNGGIPVYIARDGNAHIIIFTRERITCLRKNELGYYKVLVNTQLSSNN